ncbi:AMP-binding protein [Streptomyces bullii]|uniref:AMP-binding protein n=1 Tax=Streptomyces bullii TaxID=349910 RepID=A0ABW0USZ8_9ACTN
MRQLRARPPVAFTSIPAALTHWARERPDATAYTFVGADLAVRRRVGYRALEQAALRIAAHLRRATHPGDRVLLLFPPGLDYLTAFLGCLYSGAVAVPLYAPRPGAKPDRIAGVVHSCRPALALTTDELAGKVGEMLRPDGTAGGVEVHTVEAMPTTGHTPLQPAEPDGSGLAFLQYTSGSTGHPKGVMVSHRNLVENETAITDGFGIRPDDVILSWLPMYHDMGLIGTTLLPLFYGIPSVLLDTFAFVHDPMIWPTAIDRFGATCSGGPDFAYRLLVDRYDPERLAGVDLSAWRVAFDGAEPVNGRTLRDFAARYAGHGFDADALYPCYGLAEATLFVSGSQPGAGYRTGLFDRSAVEQGRLGAAAEGQANAVEIVSSGSAALGTTVVIRGEDGRSLPDGSVGEICVRGPGVAHGYWDDPAATEETFQARVTGHQGTFLRTGDLGALLDGQLYPVGRSKDLIIVAGRNFHPHDIESVGSLTSPYLRRGAAAAFQPDPEQRDVVLVLEVTREGVAALRADDKAARLLAEGVRREVGTECDVHLSDVVLVFPGSLPRTSSGKIRRTESRQRHLDGTLRLVHRPRPVPPGTPTAEPSPAPPAVGRTETGRETLGDTLGRLAAARLGYELTAKDHEQPLAALGLDSLKLVALKGAVEALLERPIEAGLFYGDRSLAEITEELAATPAASASTQEAGTPAAPATAPPGDGTGVHPASEGQVQLAFHDELHPEDTANILPTAVRIARRLDPDRLRAAVLAALARHPALRTTLGPLGTGTQVVHARLPLDFRLREQEDEAPEQARRFLEETAFRRFPLTSGPLVRAAAVLTPTSTLLLLACHHAVVDHWSLRIVMAEILADVLGADDTAGTGFAAAVAPGSATDWAGDQARALTSEAARAQLAALTERWRPLRDHLLLSSPLPVRRRRNPAGLVDFEVDAATTRRVHELGRSRGHTPFVLLATGYLRALHRVTGHRQIVIGTPHHGRGDWRYAETVGYLVNMLPLLGDFRDGDALDELAERTWRELRTGLDTAHLPLSRLIRALAPERHGQHPLFQATLTFQQSADGRLDEGFAIPWSGCRQTYGGVELQAVDIPPRDVAFALSLYGARHGERLVFRLQYQRDLVEENVAARVCEEFRAALRELTALPPK